jgi:hypothetical protein
MGKLVLALCAIALVLALAPPVVAQEADAASGAAFDAIPAWSDAGQPDAQDNPNLTWSYYTVLGVQLRPRVTATTYGYDFNGCLHIAGGTDNRLTFPLLLPDGSEVHYLRIYYNDTNAGTDATAWLSTFAPGQSSTDLTSVNSAGSGGYGTQLSPEIIETFDSAVNYTLTVATNTTDATVQICGVRIAYYAP